MKKWLSAACLLLSIIASQAANDLRVSRFNTENGLPDNSIRAACQDSFGLMWFCTREGICMYDGHHFKALEDPSCPILGGLSLAVFEDQAGRLWFATSKGVGWYSLETGEVKTLIQFGDEPVMDASITSDRYGQIWIAAGSIYRWRPSDGSLVRYGGGSFQSNLITMDTDGHVWFLSSEGEVYRYNIPDNAFDCVWHPETPLAGSSVRDMKADGSALLFSVRPGELLKTDIYSFQTEPVFRVDTGEIRSILHRDDGTYWLGTDKGVAIVQDGEISQWILHRPLDPSSLSGEDVWCMYQDRGRNVWIGGFYTGLNLVREANRAISRFSGEDEGGVLKGSIVRALAEMAGHKLLIGTENGGLSVLDLTDNSVEDLTPVLAPGRQLNVQGLWNDDGTLWVATFGDGVFRLDLSRRKLTGRYLEGMRTVVPYKTREGEVLVGTTDGLYRYDPAADAFLFVPALGHTFVHSLYEDSRDKLWTGTYGDGLYCRQGPDFRKFSMNDRTSALSSNYITYITEDRSRRLWVCTEGGGLCWADVQETDGAFQFRNFGRKDGFPTNITSAVCEDSDGVIWVSTSHGIVKLNPDLNGIRDIYLEVDGSLGNQYGYGSVRVMDGGQVFLGTSDGLYAFSPTMPQVRIRSSVLITDIQLRRQEQSVSISEEGRSTLRSEHITLRERDFTSLAIRFSAPYFSSPRLVMFRTELVDGHRNVVRNYSSEGVVTYTRLPAGKYQFKAEALLAGTSVSKTLTIEVIPPFYRSRTAYWLYALALLGLISLIPILLDRRRKKEMEQKLAQLESDKQKELYGAKINFFTNITHEFRTPLTLIKMPLDKIMERGRYPEEMREDLHTMQSNTNRLLALTNQLLDMRKMEKDELLPAFLNEDICAVVKEVCSWFFQVAEDQNIRIEKQLPETPVMVQCAKDMVEKILNNLLSNACKYGNGKVKVSLEVLPDGENIRIRVNSNGPRIPQRDAEKIFETFFQTQDAQQQRKQGTGLGLPFSRSLATIHHGRLYLDTAVEEWNSFVLELPVHQADVVALPAPEESVQEEEEMVAADGRRHVVLIVEDAPDMRAYLAKELSVSYNVLEASNGEKALEVVRSQRVDLVVSDIMMPVMDGCTLCNTIKSDTELCHIPVILLTAAVGMETRIETLEAGADGYIEKPFAFELLQATIDNLFRNRDIANQQFVHSPLAHFNSVVTGELDHDFMERLRGIVMEHLSEPDLNIETLTSELGTSKSTLYRKVRANMGLNINEYIRVCRLKKAAEMLSSQKYRVNEVAYQTGFSSPSYFATCFQKQFNVSPSSFIRNLKGGEKPEEESSTTER
ncbi:MAG: response regulator [Bacteroidales bacterium]|nr:response regulator [Bacteroidales bacterium]